MPFDSSWQAEFLDQRLITNFLAPDKPPGPGHHIFVDSLATDPNPLNADSTLLFKELGNRISPATGRPFYDLGNNSDNMISLLGSQGGAGNVNGALVHANDHDRYSAFIKNKVAPAVVDTYTAARQAGKTHLVGRMGETSAFTCRLG
jgi:hypothetical protein